MYLVNNDESRAEIQKQKLLRRSRSQRLGGTEVGYNEGRMTTAYNKRQKQCHSRMVTQTQAGQFR